MYETFFGMNHRPFVAAPDPSRYFPAETTETARQNLLRCLVRGEGVCLVIGPSGTGKTLLCQVLAEQLRPTLAAVHLCSGRLSSRAALYQTILHGLGRPYRGLDEGELRLALVDYLTSGEGRPSGLALLVDEAHTLPLRLLDEIRMLTNLVCAGEPRVRIVLVGSPALEERFASPKLESFSQRIVARCYLASFSRAETEQYIAAQLRAAGADPARVFTAEAAGAVYQATDGVPRLVNQLCDHALVMAYADDERQVGPRQVEAAWADLQQLPTPWTGAEAAGAAPDVIEFGGLEDDLPRGGETAMADTASAGAFPMSDEPEVELVFEEASRRPPAPSPTEAAGPLPAFRAFDEEPATAEHEEAGCSFVESFDQEEEVLQRYSTVPMEAPTEPRIRRGVEMPRPGRSHLGTTRPAGPEPVQWPSRTEPTQSAVGDRRAAESLIVCAEEGEEPEEHAAPSRPAIARQAKYRNLFARLRRN